MNFLGTLVEGRRKKQWIYVLKKWRKWWVRCACRRQSLPHEREEPKTLWIDFEESWTCREEKHKIKEIVCSVNKKQKEVR